MIISVNFCDDATVADTRSDGRYARYDGLFVFPSFNLFSISFIIIISQSRCNVNQNLYWSTYDYPVVDETMDNVRCPPGFTVWGSSCFRYINYAMRRREARRYCRRLVKATDFLFVCHI